VSFTGLEFTTCQVNQNLPLYWHLCASVCVMCVRVTRASVLNVHWSALNASLWRTKNKIPNRSDARRWIHTLCALVFCSVNPEVEAESIRIDGAPEWGDLSRDRRYRSISWNGKWGVSSGITFHCRIYRGTRMWHTLSLVNSWSIVRNSRDSVDCRGIVLSTDIGNRNGQKVVRFSKRSD